MTFPITTSFTSSTAGATITASYNGTTYGASLTILPVGVGGVTFYPSTLTAGDPAPFMVYLTGPAAAGIPVSLTSSNPAVLQVPSTVQPATGGVGVSVTGNTFAVTSQTAVTVTATYNNSSSQATLTVVPARPLTVQSLNFSPAAITGGGSAAGIVTLTGLARAGGANVALSSSSTLVQLPSPPTVYVPAGTWILNFSLATSAVSSATNVTIRASYGGVSQSALLTLVPPLPSLVSLSLAPSTVTGGTPSTGTVTLTRPAPIGGTFVEITSSFYGVARPARNGAYVPVDATSAQIPINTSAVNFITPVTITASYAGISKSTLLTVVPPGTPLAPSFLSLSPQAVTGGSPSTATVSLTGPAPSNGAVVSVTSDNPAFQVPLTITFPAGTTTASFIVGTPQVSVISTGTITAKYNGISKSSLLTVKPSGSPVRGKAAPFLASPLIPVSRTPGGPGFAFTVNGSGFAPGAQIFWNGTVLPTTFVNGSQLQGSVTALNVETNRSVAVTVANSGAASPPSNMLPLHLTYPTSVPSFGSSSLLASGIPSVVAAGDFNRDGKQDLVLGNIFYNSGLSIFLGRGDGTFGPELRLPATKSASIALGDFNGDGKLDIVVDKSMPTAEVLGIFLGNGDGTFTAMPDISLPNPPGNSSIAVGDLNGDGALDLVLTGTSLTQAYVFLGNGDGTFRSPATFGSVNQPLSIALADFNGDGRLDIVLSDYVNKAVAILLGNGDGTFQPQSKYNTNGYSYQLVVADFNGDRRPDIAVVSNGPIGTPGAGVAVLLNRGDGTFPSPVTYSPGEAFYSVASEDLNGDGKLDLVAANPNTGIKVFLGNGDGSFSPTPISVAIPTRPYSLTVLDLNNDGAPDILAPSDTDGTLPVLMQSISPILRVVPSVLSFTAEQGGATPSPLSVFISNTGGSTATWSASASQPWVTLSQNVGTAPSAIMVSANSSSLTAGTYTAILTIAATGASNSPQTIRIILTINPARVVVTSLAFNPTTVIGPANTTGTVRISAAAQAGGATVNLSSNNSALQVPSSVTVPAGASSVSFGATASSVTAQTVVTVTAMYNGVSTNSTVTVNPALPAVSLSSNNLTFAAQPVGSTGPAQNVTLTNSGTATLAISSIAIGGANSRDFTQTTTCGPSLPAGAACSISVASKPIAAGIRRAVVSIVDNASGSPHTITLTGIGTVPAAFAPIYPAQATLPVNGTQKFRINVAVTWSVQEGLDGGTIDANGLYTAPSTIGLYHVIATSAADPTQRASASVAVVATLPRFAYVANSDDNTVGMFTIEVNSGQLRANGYMSGERNPVSAATDGISLYVVNQASNNISGYSIDATSGALTSIAGSPFTAGSEPRSIALAGAFAYVVNQGSNNCSVYSIDAVSGVLRAAGTFSTNGTGPVAVQADSTGTWLYVANQTSGNVSAFAIEQITGGLTLVGTLPAALSPSSIALHPSGSYVYVANSGAGNVSGYGVDPVTGSLTLIGVYGAGTGPAALVVDSAGNFLYVANRGSEDVSAYTIDVTTGALTQLASSPFSAGTSPRSITVDPSNQFVYVGHEGSKDIWAFTIDPNSGALVPTGAVRVRGPAYSIALTGAATPVVYTPTLAYAANSVSNDVTSYTIDPTTGALTPGIAPFSVGTLPRAVTVDPSGQFAYVVNETSNDVSGFTIDRATGELTSILGSPFAAGIAPRSVTVEPSGRFTYVVNGNSSNISAYSIYLLTGALMPIPASPFSAGMGPQVINICPNGKFGYVANNRSESLSAYTIDPITGVLTPVFGSPFAAGLKPTSVVVDPSGQFAIVPNHDSNNISVYAINPTTGALTPVAGSPFGAGAGPISAAMDASGQFVFVANELSNSISVFRMSAGTGALSPVPGSPFLAGTAPQSVTVDVSGQFVYAANRDSNDVTAYAIDPLTGLLAPTAGSPFGAGIGPVSVTTIGTIQ
ncbi:MAG: beta-propeller fold lactonase family protein [Acidobacteria bacterium]|nr:beta-propeller fold lactonase family protein [Acidobacteriota bacterium]